LGRNKTQRESNAAAQAHSPVDEHDR
jgi:hypothetical protein